MQRRGPDGRFACATCGAAFAAREDYLRHVGGGRAETADAAREDVDECADRHRLKRLMCKACDRRFSFLRTYYEHIKIHGK